jgi:molybdenum cofactor cytidylyltransferase
MKVEGMILAAGLSSRAGTNKLILDVHGKTVIEKCILSMYDLCSRIVVIGGYRIEDIKEIISEYPKVELIYNDDYLEGMFSSIKKGLINIEGTRFFLIPGDYAAINKKTYEKILTIDKDIVIPLYNKRRGHPLLMKSHLIKEILKDDSCKTLRDFINKNVVSFVDVDDGGILMDIDTMEDYETILHFLKS